MSDPCPHWWLLDSPSGEHYVTGRCKRCGAERQFECTLPENAVWKANDKTMASVFSPTVPSEGWRTWVLP